MNLSVSNIAWDAKNDEEMYGYLSKLGFKGLEIAPTRIFPQNPYEDLESAKAFANILKEKYNLSISSIQSIWYGKTERVFGDKSERQILINYTKKAIDFANAVDCKNIVFGCPKNRNIVNENDNIVAEEFFGLLGEYAFKNNTVLSIEPNPTIYGTNYINYTNQAFELVSNIKCPGFKVNIDFGTIIQNNEDLTIIEKNLHQVNHIHISEPNLEKIEKRNLHQQLAIILKENKYNGFLSIEMKNQNNLDIVKDAMKYLQEVFI